MANTLLTIGQITREGAMVLENNIKMVGYMNKEYSDQFGRDGAKIGSVLNVRKPPRFLGRTGQALSLEDITESSVPLTLTTQFGVDMTVTTADLALNIDDFSKRFVQPAIKAIANRVDFDSTLLYQTVNNVIGTPGTIPNAAFTYLQVGQRLNEEACPVDGRKMVITPGMQAVIVDTLKGLFQDGTAIAKQYREGAIGKGLGFDPIAMDQNIRTHIVGALGGTPTVNGAGQTGNSLITQAWSNSITGVLKRGDVFTIGSGATGVFAVNPQSRQSTGALRQFVVTADQNSSGAGAVTIPISPSIIVSGPFQNVTGQTAAITGPASGATINVLGAANTNTPQAMAFVEDAFMMATADLPLPNGVAMKDRQNYKGLSIRMIQNYDINTDREPLRTDILYGFAALYPELACRLAS
jgi:hypothetical protein